MATALMKILVIAIIVQIGASVLRMLSTKAESFTGTVNILGKIPQ